MNYDAISIIYSKCVFVALLIQHANPIFSAPYYIVHCGHIFFQHYLINGTIFGGPGGGRKLLNIKYVFWFSLQLSSETPLILRIIQRVYVINWHKLFMCQYRLFLSDFNKTLIYFFSKIFSKKKFQILNLMKIRPAGAELFHADGRTDGQTDKHDETNSRCS